MSIYDPRDPAEQTEPREKNGQTRIARYLCCMKAPFVLVNPQKLRSNTFIGAPTFGEERRNHAQFFKVERVAQERRGRLLGTEDPLKGPLVRSGLPRC